MVLGSGQYKIGEDLPAGVYTFKFVQNGDSDVSLQTAIRNGQ